MRRSRTMWSRRMKWKSRTREHKQLSSSKQVRPRSVIWTELLGWILNAESLTTLSLQRMQCWSGWLRALVAPSPLPSRINCVCFHCCSRWKAFIYSADLKLLLPKTFRTFLPIISLPSVPDCSSWERWQLRWTEERCQNLPVSDVSGTSLHRANPNGSQCSPGGKIPQSLLVFLSVWD